MFSHRVLPFRKPPFTLVGIDEFAAIEAIGVEIDYDRVPVLDEGDPWSATFVDPPSAIAMVSALRMEAGVTMSRGLIPFRVIVTKQSTSCSGNSSVRRASSEAGATMCSRASSMVTP
jgi:hypothetical protein